MCKSCGKKKLTVEVTGCENGIYHGMIGQVLGVEIEDKVTYVNVFFEDLKRRVYFAPEELQEIK